MAKPSERAGLIFDMERFSMGDGPGVRTVVFLKGCNMRCHWCHNPEGLAAEPELRFHAGRCLGCGACFEACPTKALREGGELPAWDPSRCLSCFRCARACYAQALVRTGRRVTVPEVLAEVLEDAAFYRRSGGGVTLSGGEASLQAAFCLELLSQCKEQAVHTALETNLSLPWRAYEPLLPVCDLFMADIKTMDAERHQQATGLPLAGILANIGKLDAAGKPFVIRTPVVPGLNDTPEDIAPVASFLARLPRLLYYELLRYHPLGRSKPVSLGRQNPLPNLQPPSGSHMRALALAALRAGIPVYADGRAVTASERKEGFHGNAGGIHLSREARCAAGPQGSANPGKDKTKRLYG